MPRNQHITSLGFRLENTGDVARVRPLLRASGLTAIDEADDTGPWEASTYLVAATTAGGTAACAGWTRHDEYVLLHSLAVAPPSRGSGVGASILATVLGEIMDSDPVREAYLTTRVATHFFASFSFEKLAAPELPEPVAEHPIFAQAGADSQPMVRRYKPNKRGLDQCAFRLIHNTTTDATLPAGSVFLFRQAGSTLEASYRGTPVRRGHLVGSVQSHELNFLWHHVLDDGSLANGDGSIFVDELDDGRRELREKIGGRNPGELLLREV
ncbi:MAG: GNAT family N-acetyltransferase [Persicimonas sp.]